MANHGGCKVDSLVWMLAGALLVCLSVGGSAFAKGAPNPRTAEKVNNRAFLGVESEEGVMLLRWTGKKDTPLAPGFTLSACGRELVATVDNLQTLVGRPFMAVVARDGKRWVVTRLEFECQ